MNCESTHEKNAGLCYPLCRSGFHGLGPVCWGKNPNGWVNCGLGSSVSKSKCFSVIFDQITSIGELALNIATFGAANAPKVIKGSKKAL